jgi:hypothetical protein
VRSLRAVLGDFEGTLVDAGAASAGVSAGVSAEAAGVRAVVAPTHVTVPAKVPVRPGRTLVSSLADLDGATLARLG